MTAICAFRPPGIDVSLSFLVMSSDVAVGGIAAGRDETGATIFAPKALPGKPVEFATPKSRCEIMDFRAARNS
jgi:hypothetical protein